MNYYWMYYDTVSGAVAPQHSNVSPLDSDGQFDSNMIPVGFSVVGPYDDSGDNNMPSAFQSAYDNPPAFLYQNGAFVANPNYNSSAIALAQSQTSQMAAINAGYAATMAAGFTSNATGTAVVYGAQLQDIVDLQVTQSAINQGLETFPIEYGALAGTVVNITSQTMLTQLESDMNAFAWAQKKQLRTLTTQVNAQTEPPTTPVTWTPGAYTPEPAPTS